MPLIRVSWVNQFGADSVPRLKKNQFSLICLLFIIIKNSKNLVLENVMQLLQILFFRSMSSREVQNARTLTRFYAFVKWENVAK